MLQITLPVQRHLLRQIWYGLVVLVWAVITVQLVGVWIMILGGATGLLGNSANNAGSNSALILAGVIMLIPLALMAAFGTIVIYAFLWQIAGQEIIAVNSQSVRLSRQLFSWTRSSDYLAAGIRDLRIFQTSWEFAPITSLKKLLGRNGVIAFNYRAKTIRFGLEIDDVKAKQIISEIQEIIP